MIRNRICRQRRNETHAGSLFYIHETKRNDLGNLISALIYSLGFYTHSHTHTAFAQQTRICFLHAYKIFNSYYMI